MNKKLYFLYIALLSANVYGLSLDDVIGEYKKIYNDKNRAIELEIIEEQIKSENEDYTFTLNTSFNQKTEGLFSSSSDDEDTEDDPFGSSDDFFNSGDIEKYYNIYLNASYKDIYVYSQVEINEKNSYTENLKLGYKKDLKDILFALEKKNEKIKEIEKNIKILQIDKDEREEIKDIIKKYSEIAKKRNSLKSLNFYLKILEEKRNLLNAKLEYGEGSIFDLENLNFEYEEKNSELAYEKLKYQNLIDSLGKKIELSIDDSFEFNDFEIDLLGYENIDYLLKEKEYDKKKKEFDLKKKRGCADINLDTSYDFEQEEAVYSLEFDLFANSRAEIRRDRLQKKKLERELRKLSEKNSMKENEVEQYYKYLLEKMKIKEKELISFEKRDKKIEKLYENSRIELLDYLKYKEEYLKVKLEQEDLRVDIYEFKYQMRYCKTYDI